MGRLTEWLGFEIYGANPSRARRAGINTVLASVLLASYGSWTQFVPSRLVANVGTCLAAAVSLALILFVSHGVATGRFEWPDQQRVRWRLLTYVLAFVGIYCLAWLTLVLAAPDILTRIFGTYQSKSLILEASSDRHRKFCHHQLQGSELAFPGYFCIPAYEISLFAPRGEVVLSGPSTMLGLHVSQIEPGVPEASLPVK